MPDPVIRLGRDEDADGFIDLIGACWAQHPGVLLDVDGEMPELRSLASYYAGQGGMLWSADHGGSLEGMIATRPLDDAEWEICRVYVRPSRHGAGLGHRLLDTAEAYAIAAGARRLRLWTDTRFNRAHRFYEKRSFVRSGPIRVLNDISHSLEFAYAKPVDGVVVLDAAAAASAEVRLAAISRTVAGADGWPQAPGPDAWRRITRQVATGEAMLLAGWRDGTLSGMVRLRVGTTLDRRHRAALGPILVEPRFRRRGLARAMVDTAEGEALSSGRWLLTVDTPAGGAGEMLCHASGWQLVGVVPGYTRRTDSRLDDAAFFWKHVGR